MSLSLLSFSGWKYEEEKIHANLEPIYKLVVAILLGQASHPLILSHPIHNPLDETDHLPSPHMPKPTKPYREPLSLFIRIQTILASPS
jgi:hypothetical protein